MFAYTRDSDYVPESRWLGSPWATSGCLEIQRRSLTGERRMGWSRRSWDRRGSAHPGGGRETAQWGRCHASWRRVSVKNGTWAGVARNGEGFSRSGRIAVTLARRQSAPYSAGVVSVLHQGYSSDRFSRACPDDPLTSHDAADSPGWAEVAPWPAGGRCSAGIISTAVARGRGQSIGGTRCSSTARDATHQPPSQPPSR